MPDAVTGSLSPAQIAPAATPATSSGGGALDKNAFLKLLVAQLKYQNPMSPNDPDQFLAQSAQFTMVEKLEELAKAQTESAGWQRLLTGQGLVGRQVTGKDVAGADVTAVVTGLRVEAAGPVLQLEGGSSMQLSGVQAVGARTSTQATGPAATSAPTSAGTTPAGTTTAGTTPAGTTTAGTTPAGTTTGPAATA